MATIQDFWNEIDSRIDDRFSMFLGNGGATSDTSGTPPASAGGLPIHNNLHHEPPLAIASDLTAHIATIASDSTLGHIRIGDGLVIDGDGIVSVVGEGLLSFLDLTDTPDAYTGQANRVVIVKDDETGLEFHALTASDVGALTQAVADTLYDPIGEAAAEVAAHVLAPNPHPQYLTQAEGDALYLGLGSVTAFGLSLINDADAAAARATLELIAGGAGDIWVARAGDTMTGDLLIQTVGASLTVQATVSGANLVIQSDLGNANFQFTSAKNFQDQINLNILESGVAKARWVIVKNNDLETGINHAGANLEVRRRTDAGGALGTVLFLVRETGFVGINRATAASVEYQLDVSGTIRADSSTGGTLLLTRSDSSLNLNDLIGVVQYSSNLDADLTSKFVFAEIEARSSRAVTTNAPTGRIHLKTTGVAAGTDPVERIVTGCVQTLTDAATNLFDVTLNAGEMAGGSVHWTIIASNGTDHQSYTGITTYAVVNKAGTYTSQITHNTTNDAKAVSSGTLTAAWAVLNGTNKVTIRVTPTGSLTETTYRIIYTIITNSPQAITVLTV